MEGKCSYMVFTSSGSPMSARARLWCCLAAAAHKLLLYSCSQRLMSEWGYKEKETREIKNKKGENKLELLADVLASIQV